MATNCMNMFVAALNAGTGRPLSAVATVWPRIRRRCAGLGTGGGGRVGPAVLPSSVGVHVFGEFAWALKPKAETAWTRPFTSQSTNCAGEGEAAGMLGRGGAGASSPSPSAATTAAVGFLMPFFTCLRSSGVSRTWPKTASGPSHHSGGRPAGAASGVYVAAGRRLREASVLPSLPASPSPSASASFVAAAASVSWCPSGSGSLAGGCCGCGVAGSGSVGFGWWRSRLRNKMSSSKALFVGTHTGGSSTN